MEQQFEITVQEFLELLQFEAQVSGQITVNEFIQEKVYALEEEQKEFQYKPEQSQGGFEHYIKTKSAPQEWIDS